MDFLKPSSFIDFSCFNDFCGVSDGFWDGMGYFEDVFMESRVVFLTQG